MSIGSVGTGISGGSHATAEVKVEIKAPEMKISEKSISSQAIKAQKNKGEQESALGMDSSLEIRQKMLSAGYIPSFQEKKLMESIEKTNAELVGANRELQISIHDKTHRVMAKVIDKETKEVIKEIPSEKLLDIVYSMLEYSGLVVDEKM
ncbi:flagellar protein FlaG [Sporanaerobium hydrogeniformans]|uniref:flagellar protein FlaG n=1 Tax=Sporanaerobium hydrogeniformans TaxID=3072179 RepID=UPI0026A16250|nr:flagellar protein FlaG [Sporanaerobium hydrogeniformans]